MKLEIWKSVTGYEGLYEVSNLGQVKSVERLSDHRGSKRKVCERILKQSINTKGYYLVCLSKGGKTKIAHVHVLVAIEFLGHVPNGYMIVVDHIKNDKSKNAASDLQIVTQRHNATKDSINKTGFAGVLKYREKFRSQIYYKNNTYSLGTFASPFHAHVNYLRYVSMVDHPLFSARQLKSMVKYEKSFRD